MQQAIDTMRYLSSSKICRPQTVSKKGAGHKNSWKLDRGESKKKKGGLTSTCNKLALIKGRLAKNLDGDR